MLYLRLTVTMIKKIKNKKYSVYNTSSNLKKKKYNKTNVGVNIA